MAVAGVPPRSGAQAATSLRSTWSSPPPDPNAASGPFPIRVGVHSGPVMAGIIGTRKFAYDVWGDTVNIASRLEGASQPNRVLISATTANQLSGEFKLDGPHKIATKELRDVEAFFVSYS